VQRYSCLSIISCFECLFCWLMVMVASVCIVGCVYMATPTGRGGGSLSWQRVPLSHLALPINRDVQYIAVIMYSAVISIIMHCTSRLTGHARRDNGRHCQDNALPPPRRVGVAVYYCTRNCHINSRLLKHSKQLLTTSAHHRHRRPFLYI